MRVAVIVNDMSEVNVDAATIKAGSVHVAHRQSEMVALESGCICCTLRQDLLEEVAKLAGEGKFDYLVIESTGMAAPAPVAETFSFGETGPGRVLGDVARLDTLVTVVDCSRFFDNMNSLESIDEDECGIGGQPGSLVSLLIEQVEFATTILLNKTDLVSPDELETVAAFVKKLNPGATVLRCTNSAVPLDSVLNTKAYSLDCAALMPGWLMELQGDAAQEKEDQEAPAAPTDGPDAPADCCAAGACASEAPSTGCKAAAAASDCCGSSTCESKASGGSCKEGTAECCATGTCRKQSNTLVSYGVGSFVFRSAARPFHPQRLHGALDVLFAPDSVASIVASGGADDGSLGVVLRSKGSLWLASAHDTMVMWAQAGRHFALDPDRPWLAAMPEGFEAELDEEEQAELEAERAGFHPTWGDRGSELVFIGLGLNEAAISELLQRALLTDAELAEGPEAWAELPCPFVEAWAAAAAEADEEGVEEG